MVTNELKTRGHLGAVDENRGSNTTVNAVIPTAGGWGPCAGHRRVNGRELKVEGEQKVRVERQSQVIDLLVLKHLDRVRTRIPNPV